MNALARALPDMSGLIHGRTGRSDQTASRRDAPAPDPALALAEAERRGYLDGAAAARAECEAVRTADAAAFERRLAEERERWTTEQGARLAEALPAAMREIESNLVEAVTPILLPFLQLAVRERALDDLRQSVQALLEDPAHPPIRIAGPADLLDELRSRLPDAVVEFAAGAEPEIRVVAGQTVIQTQLGAWRDRLAEAVR